MFGRKSNTQSSKARYRFDYEFGIRNTGSHEFYRDFASLEEAQTVQKVLLDEFRRAIKEDVVVEIEPGLVIRGSDMTWFWVGDAYVQ